jgi:hypothetical protein
LCFELGRFGLKFLLLAIETLAFLFEVDQAFERHCEFGATGEHRAG